jgi:hypothetical protein
MPALLKSILDLALTDAGITALATGLAIILALVLRSNRKALKAVVEAAHFAYDAVNAIKDQTATKIDDKAAIALGIIADRLGRELTASEESAAVAVFDARHGQESDAAEIAKKAIAAGLKVGSQIGGA